MQGIQSASADGIMSHSATIAHHPLSQTLSTFRQTHPLQSISMVRTSWTYYDTGGDKFPLLLLHGGGGFAEAMFPQIMGLAERHRVIAPNIPATLHQFDDVINGLSILLNALNIEKIHLYGISLGGHIAQVFIRRQFDRIQDMILSHTAIPCEHLAQKSAMQKNLLRMYPSSILIPMFKRNTRNQITSASVSISDEEREFWIDYFDGQYDNLITKRHILSRAHLMSEYFQQFAFTSSDLNYWEGRQLILESSHDDVYEEGDRGALIAMYPRTWTHTFEGYPHLATILAHQETVEIIIDFLAGGAYGRL